ncbi:hypothetical protein PV05_08809 [Exophiala xenobiotica]|uniref:endo-1,3(4)-beta-glucanase n=1 Tax=Exophiala xenobiotica TaxID=348802 RepID=A0A0D2EZQ2_9EURO|nr:uncharacterized protein PV05_08809 [Exophiala xenobiotica]KIW53219.1 hypothetical protein PV05_08809 [Exophiala xenobiotica]
MAVHSYGFKCAGCSFLLACLLWFPYASAQTSSVYQLDSEYSGTNFFDGWDFYTGGDPTGGFVTYYSRSSAQQAGMINSSASQPSYIGSDYTTLIGSTSAAGRPSVRISTKRSWTHGLFIGDFNHSPAGICGTWPAFWTLGPNWPYNGEIDIMEGANMNMYNGMTLHAAPNCTIAGDSRSMSGQLQTNNCAYYPGYNVGCSISDRRGPSYGASFNAQGGGVYAMQWTSDYIRVWFFARGTIPSDITNQAPNPSSWGLPAAEFQGSCVIDQKFQAHKIIMNNAFCGEYAGAASVWNSSTNSCAASTNYSTCNGYVAGQPAAFQNAYWSIKSVRVYQLADSSSNATSSPYIASLQPTSTISSTSSAPTPTPTTSLCPGYNFTVVQSGAFKYEIECGVNPGGSDLGAPYSGYPVNSFEDCVGGCSYWNANVTANICGAVAYQISNKACYWKRSAGSTPLNPAFNGARLIYYAYPQVTDDPRSQTTTTSSSGTYVQTVATANTYVNPSVASTTSYSLVSETPASSLTDGVGMGGDGTTTSSSLPSSSTSISSSMSSTPSTGSSTTSNTPTTSLSLTTTSFATTTSSSASRSTASQSSPTSSSTSTTSRSSSTQSTPTPGQSSIVSTPNLGSQATTTVQPSNPTSLSITSSPATSMMASSTTTSAVFPSSSTSGLPHSSTTPGQTTLTSSQTTAHSSTSSAASTQPPTSTQHSSAPSTTLSAPILASSGTSSSLATQTSSSRPLQSSSIRTTSAIGPIFGSSSVTASSTLGTPSTSLSLVARSTTTRLISPSTTTTSLATDASGSTTITTRSPQQPTTASVSTSQIISTRPPSSPTTSVFESPTTSPALPGPTHVASFEYAGCLGPIPDSPFADSFILVETSVSMSIEECISDCSGQNYAGLFDAECFCSSFNGTPSDSDCVTYPDSACNVPCPGDAAQKCGGIAELPSRFAKRQFSGGDNVVVLITTYNNTLANVDPGGLSTASTSSTTLAPSLSSSTSTSPPLPPPSTTSTAAMESTSSTTASAPTQIDSPILASTTPTASSHIISSSTLPLTSSSNAGLTLSPTTISTTYTTVCASHLYTCPTPTATHLTTTVVALHCGCQDMLGPSVPMTITTTVVLVPCPSSEEYPYPPHLNVAGGEGDAGEVPPVSMTLTTTTLTVPCTESISSMASDVQRWYASASASAAAAAAAATATPIPNANADSQTPTNGDNTGSDSNPNPVAGPGPVPGPGESAGQGPRPGQRQGQNQEQPHPYQPYSFPISFPMTTAAPPATPAPASLPSPSPSPTPSTTVTLTLTIAPVAFNTTSTSTNSSTGALVDAQGNANASMHVGVVPTTRISSGNGNGNGNGEPARSGGTRLLLPPMAVSRLTGLSALGSGLVVASLTTFGFLLSFLMG